MRKLIILLFSFLTFANPHLTHAFDRTTFVTIANPVRGYEGWTGEKFQTPLDLPKFQYHEATFSAQPITWLLRFDAVKDATISGFFRTLTATDSSQTVGAFLEITPSLNDLVNVPRPRSGYFLQPPGVFLTGYNQQDRIKLIDAYMVEFYKTFGYFPRSVAAWYIDSFSLEYLSVKYSVTAAILCDEQYTTDAYRIWGAYLGSPYYPSKTNALIPASSSKNRIPLVITKWAIRDPFNFYGYRHSSSYSIQVNDYLSYGLSTSYFEKLLGIYSQEGFNDFSHLVIGLENDYPLIYEDEIHSVYQLLSDAKAKYQINMISLSGFGEWFRRFYPEGSPPFLYQTSDPLEKSSGKVIWYQNPHYRLGLKSENGSTKILDFRIYNQLEAEPYYTYPNTQSDLFVETPFIIDTIKFPEKQYTLPISLDNLKTQKGYWSVEILDGDKKLTLNNQSVTFSNFSPPPITSDEIIVKSSPLKTSWIFSPQTPFVTSLKSTIANTAKILLSLLFIFFIFKKRLTLPPVSVIVTGTVVSIISLMVVFKSGLVFPFGMGFWGPNGHDALFHLSLINAFAQNPLSLSHPQLAGFPIQNYHIAFDYLLALMVRILDIPALDLYFRIVPLTMIISIVYLIYLWLKKLSFSTFTINLAIIGACLTGSLGFIVTIFQKHEIFSGESLFWANQSVSILLNPPFALSLIILLLFFNILETKKPFSAKRFLVLCLLGGILSQIKIYSFLLLLVALFLNRLWKLTVGVALIGFLFILPTLSLSGSPFLFSPLWFVNTMVASGDRLNLKILAEALQSYAAQGLFAKYLLISLVSSMIFVLGNLGVRLLGTISLLKNNLTLSEKLSRSIIFFGLFLPFVIIQKINPWNTIQFTYYSLFFLSLFSAKVIGDLRSRRTKIIFVILIAALALPTTTGTLKDYVSGNSASRISFNELRLLDVLRWSPPGIVLSPVYGTFAPSQIYDPRSLYDYTSTAYISALSGRQEFLSDTINLDITGYAYQSRSKDVQRFYNTQDSVWAKQFLTGNKIRYIYELSDKPFKISREDLCLTKIFDSGEINLYKVSCYGEDFGSH